MKMTKTILFGAAVLTTVLGLSACKNDDDDNPPITGGGTDYAVSYNNADGNAEDKEADRKTPNITAGVFRAWQRGSLKNLGSLIKITLKSGQNTNKEPSLSGNNSGLIGFAWDLCTTQGTETDNNTAPENFNMVAIRNWNGKLYACVSRYYNITNKQGNNFGVSSANRQIVDFKSTPSVPSEYDVSDGFQDLDIAPPADEISVWVDIAIVPPENTEQWDKDKCGTAATRALKEYKSAEPGSWVIAIYGKDPWTTESTTSTTLPVNNGVYVIKAKTNAGAGSGYDASTISLTESQKKQAVFAHVYKGAALNGSWKYVRQSFPTK